MYGNRSNGKAHGIVFTKSIVVDAMLEEVGYTAAKDLRNVRVVEPAAGDGAFALEIIARLYKSSVNFDFDFNTALQNLKFFEIDKEKAQELDENVKALLRDLNMTSSAKLIFEEDFLLAEAAVCDVIVGNPPYVRHENIPASQKAAYRARFTTFRHRSDLYVPFYEKGLALLSAGGVLCYICSNRWLKNQYGIKLRELITQSFDLHRIVNLENTNPFQESVTAYPAITTIKNRQQQHKTELYELDDLNDLFRLGKKEVLPHRSFHTDSENWFEDPLLSLNQTQQYDLIENQGFKIGIGVATGSDKIFISKDFQGKIEDELLVPILTSRDVKGDKFDWQGNYLINPFTANGQLIDLPAYPKAHGYFCSNKGVLMQRHVSKKNESNWYKTIDKVDPDLLHKPKIILPDISGNKYLFIDKGSFYPHHNLYYITGNDIEQLKVLAAFLLSDFVKNQLAAIGNKMNGGYPRWQSQNLRKLKIPALNLLSNAMQQKIKHAYEMKDIVLINRLVHSYTHEPLQLVCI